MNHSLIRFQHGAIKTLLDEVRSQKYIADYLGVHPVLISYELNRVQRVITTPRWPSQTMNRSVPNVADPPYSPHERGPNECLNRGLWAFISKGYPIESISDAEMTWIAKAMNIRPRKGLSWKTPLQLFREDLPKKFD